jgi:hypothetical protein
MSERIKTDVHFIGFQVRVKGLPVALVNLPSHSTTVYDWHKHNIVNVREYGRALLAMADKHVPIEMIGR